MPGDKTDKVRYILQKSSTAGLHGGMGSPVYKLGWWNRIPGAVPGVSQRAAEKLVIDAQLAAMPGEWNEVDKMMDYPITTLEGIYKDLGLPRDQQKKLDAILREEVVTAKRVTDFASSIYQQLKITPFPPALTNRILINAKKYFNHKKTVDAPKGMERYEFRLNKAEPREEPRYIYTIGE